MIDCFWFSQRCKFTDFDLNEVTLIDPAAQRIFLNAPLQDDVMTYTAQDFNKQIQYWTIINYYASSKPLFCKAGESCDK